MRIEQGKNPVVQSLYYSFKEKVMSIIYIYIYIYIYMSMHAYIGTNNKEHHCQ